MHPKPAFPARCITHRATMGPHQSVLSSHPAWGHPSAHRDESMAVSGLKQSQQEAKGPLGLHMEGSTHTHSPKQRRVHSCTGNPLPGTHCQHGSYVAIYILKPFWEQAFCWREALPRSHSLSRGLSTALNTLGGAHNVGWAFRIGRSLLFFFFSSTLSFLKIP